MRGTWRKRQSLRHGEIVQSYENPLPSNESAEKYAISSALQHESMLRGLSVILATEHFSLEKHRVIWAAIRKLYESDDPVNFHTLLAELARIPGVIDSAGGLGYLAELSDSTPDVHSAVWAKPILETYARRRLIVKCNEAMIRLGSSIESQALISQDLEDEARTCAMIGEPASGFASLADCIREAGGMDKFLMRGSGDAVPYPWASMNRMTRGGMRPGQVIVIAGPSGQGKTTLALNLAFHAAISQCGTPLVFSLEMDKYEINAKLLSLASRVDSYHFDHLEDYERPSVAEGRRILTENEILVEDEDCVSISAIRSTVKKFMATQKVSMVLIDYIQLVEGKQSLREIREQEIARIMRGIKRMAMQLKVPVIALSQILEDAGAGTREPELKDLRESRSIGHTANLVAFLHFTRRYDMASGIPTGQLDLLIRKQRNGAEGRFTLNFHAPTGRFYEPI